MGILFQANHCLIKPFYGGQEQLNRFGAFTRQIHAFMPVSAWLTNRFNLASAQNEQTQEIEEPANTRNIG